jgi:hypothetical protein
MPFQSKAQVRKFGELLKQGRITQATFDEWAKGVDIGSLPEHKSDLKPKPPFAVVTAKRKPK